MNMNDHFIDNTESIVPTDDWLFDIGVRYIIECIDVHFKQGSVYPDMIYCVCPISHTLFLADAGKLDVFNELSKLASTYKTPIENLEHIINLHKL